MPTWTQPDWTTWSDEEPPTVDLSVYLQATEEELCDILSIREGMTAPLYQMMQYHLGWLDTQLVPEEAPRGKRLRPLLCLLACEATGGDWRRALGAAAAVELVHNFSLLHDDIEDNSALRRHRATVWSLWGIAQGINAGDGMWAVARLAVHRLSRAGCGPAQVLWVARLLDHACLELCTGQFLDISFEERESVSLAEYERMIAGKTAALLAAALAMGAVLGGSHEQAVGAYQAFGYELGLTFQIRDDILGIWGDPARTGKSAASDILARKKTLPALYALQWERDHGYTDLARIYARPRLVPEHVPEVLGLLERAGALEFARDQVREHHRRTEISLVAAVAGASGPLSAQDRLSELAFSLVDRAF